MVSILLLWTGGYYVHLAGWMAREHPHQNVYFNSISSLFGGKAGLNVTTGACLCGRGWNSCWSRTRVRQFMWWMGMGSGKPADITDDDRDRIVLTDGFTDETEYYLYTYRFPASHEFDEYHSTRVDGCDSDIYESDDMRVETE